MVRCAALGLIAAAVVTPASAATLTFADGICDYRVVYDRAKVDGTRLQATFEYLADLSTSTELAPIFTTPEEIAAIDVPAYRARCATHRQRLADMALVEDAEVAALRRREIADLGATCARVSASLAAAKGDLAPARAVAPACGRYADLLALPEPQLKAQWNDLVTDLCPASTDVHICAGHLQRAGEGPGSDTTLRLAVLERWSQCAMTPDSIADGSKRKLLETLAKRYHAEAIACAQ